MKSNHLCPHCGNPLAALFKEWLSKQNAKAAAAGGRTKTPARLAAVAKARQVRLDKHRSDKGVDNIVLLSKLAKKKGSK